MADGSELEYRQIQEQRMALNRHIYLWDQICLPLSTGVFSALAAATWAISSNAGLAFGVAAGTAFILLVFWRRNAHILDGEIVRLYPRILELETKLQFEFYFEYLFSHLRKGVRTKVCVGGRVRPENLTELPSTLHNFLEDLLEWVKWIWSLFVRTPEAHNEVDYAILKTDSENRKKFIEVIRGGGARVLDSRGHFEKDLVAAFPMTVTVFVIAVILLPFRWVSSSLQQKGQCQNGGNVGSNNLGQDAESEQPSDTTKQLLEKCFSRQAQLLRELFQSYGLSQSLLTVGVAYFPLGVALIFYGAQSSDSHLVFVGIGVMVVAVTSLFASLIASAKMRRR